MSYYKDFIENNLNNPEQMQYELNNCLSRCPKYEPDKFLQYI